MHLMKFLQTLARNMRINLGRRNICMTEQELHHPQVSTMIQ
jgi:hypothetical protein